MNIKKKPEGRHTLLNVAPLDLGSQKSEFWTSETLNVTHAGMEVFVACTHVHRCDFSSLPGNMQFEGFTVSRGRAARLSREESCSGVPSVSAPWMLYHSQEQSRHILGQGDWGRNPSPPWQRPTMEIFIFFSQPKKNSLLQGEKKTLFYLGFLLRLDYSLSQG